MKNATAARSCLAALALFACVATAACTTNVTDDITIDVDGGGAASSTPAASAVPTAPAAPTAAPTAAPSASATGSGTTGGAPAPTSPGSSGSTPPPPAPAQGFAGLFATGVDDSGNLLAVGATDAHYVLSSNNPANPGPAAIVIEPASDGTSIQNTGTSQWISINAQGNAGGTTDSYTYTTTFTLTGVDPGAATVSGSWA